jgi:type IV pilus assembly protein PilC
MEAFTYKGISEGKYVDGEIEALNLDEASHKLKEQKIIITNIVRSSKKKKTEVKEKKKGKAGLPILQVLGMLRDQIESPAMKDIIEEIRKSLEGGVTLSKCFEKYPELFDNVYINLIKAGEASGKLDVFLLKIVESLEKKENIKKKIKSALMYPSIMFTVAVTVSAFMLVKVVPVFAKMYDGMGIELPTATATIMAMSDFLRGTGGKVLLFGLIGFVLGFRYITSKNEKMKYAWHKQVLKLPIFGDMILKSMLARISLIMGNLSAAGVNLLESLEISKSVSTNVVVLESLENVKKGVFSGDTLTKLFLKDPLFPPTFSQLISVGEQTGQLDEMFGSVAKYYEAEFDTTVDNLSSLIEPIMIVFMGIMIGGLMIAMYSPIFNVGALIG